MPVSKRPPILPQSQSPQQNQKPRSKPSEESHPQFTSGQQVETRFHERFPRIPIPAEAAELPNDITELNDNQLGNLINHYSAWREYSEAELIVALIDANDRKFELDLITAKDMLQFGAGSGVSRHRETSAARLEEAHRLHNYARLYADMVSLKATSFKDTVATLSREITRRSNKPY